MIDVVTAIKYLEDWRKGQRAPIVDDLRKWDNSGMWCIGREVEL